MTRDLALVLFIAALLLLAIRTGEDAPPRLAMARVTIPAQLAPCPVVKPRGLPTTERKA